MNMTSVRPAGRCPAPATGPLPATDPLPDSAAPPTRARRAARTRRAHPSHGTGMASHDGVPTALALVAGLGLGVVLGAALLTLRPVSLTATWTATSVGRVAAVVGTYGMLWMILLVARVAPIEHALGHDRLVALHRRLAPWSIWLIGVHVIASVLAYAMPTGSSWWAQLWELTSTVPWILPADAAVIVLVVAGVASYRRARRRLRHEVWWTIHLYTYLAAALAFAHQLTVDGPFLSGWARWTWIAYYVVVSALVLGYRVVLPLARSLRHDLRVDRVVPEADGVVSVWVSGRRLDRIGIRPGQFADWRFLTPGLAYEAHPYSFSARPHADLLRITVKDLGDASRLMARLRPGTRVLMEGPYGVMTAERVAPTGRVVLVAGGVGVAPVRALAEEVSDRGGKVDVLVRSSSLGDLALAGELRALARRPGVRLHELVGHRDIHPMDAAQLAALVPDLSSADVYVCGPEGLTAQVMDAARTLGVPEDHLHTEDFSM